MTEADFTDLEANLREPSKVCDNIFEGLRVFFFTQQHTHERMDKVYVRWNTITWWIGDGAISL